MATAFQQYSGCAVLKARFGGNLQLSGQRACRPAFPVAFANGIMTHFPLCAADLTTSRDRRRDHLCARFGPHKECMREGDTPAVAAETAGKGEASAAGRDSGSGYCKNCPPGCLYSRPHV